MEILNFERLRRAADDSLARAPQNPRRLILLHTAVTVLLQLATVGAGFLLDRGIGATGGLSGLGLRAVLTTVSQSLQLLVPLFLTFWEAGYVFATLRIAKGAPAAPGALLEGFRRFGPLFRLALLRGLIYLLLWFAASNLGSILFFFTPWSRSLMNGVTAVVQEGQALTPELQTQIMALAQEYMPLLLGLALIPFLPLAVFVFYNTRLADLALLDNPQIGAMNALRNSLFLMRGQKWAMFRLDLHFWWFHGLNLIIGVLSYGDVLLPLLGLTLPFSETTGFFLFLVLSLLLQLGLYLLFRNRVSVTYAQAYLALLPPEVRAARENPQ